ncbi:thymidylate kinase [Vibrio phage VAP7]|uniref:Thymidylate kinase n=1 Tax=Vibrio phage VAP7 TaxID=2584487 RepID=A0A4Y5TX48_9CAUD|nr:thymidylate kinase [Vibrio phage VAP7]QDB73216.1 thymidylate kinase [Vibrio phage VAP7]UFD98099.1 hypothetical protein [Vibrio phage BX-1]
MSKTKPTGIILLEGPDAAGKTTLAEAFKKVVPNTEIIHLTWSPKLETVMSDYNIGLLAHAEELAKDRLVILDRQCISTYVYQSTFRPEKASHHPSLYAQLAKYCPSISIIFCLPEFDTWKQNFLDMCASREEMYGAEKLEQMIEVYRRYDVIARGPQTSEDQKLTWYPDNVLMDQIMDGGVLKHMHSYVYDFTKLMDNEGLLFAEGFLLGHQAHQEKFK